MRLRSCENSSINGFIYDVSRGDSGAGTAWAWGNNQYGQLGNGTTSNSSTPIQVSSLSSIQSQTNASYTYNGDGLRMSKTVSGTSEAFSWDLKEGHAWPR